MNRSIYTLGGIGALVLALTGAWGWLSAGQITGWALLVHVAAAPLLLIGLVWLGITQAPRYARPETSTASRAAFWLMLSAGWFTCAVIVSAMFPWFGTQGQETIYSLHRWSALLFIVSAAVFALTCCRSERRVIRQVEGPKS